MCMGISHIRGKPTAYQLCTWTLESSPELESQFCHLVVCDFAQIISFPICELTVLFLLRGYWADYQRSCMYSA